MKVCVRAPRHLSKAMFRVENALKRFAPPSVSFVETGAEADLQVLHVIGADAITYESEADKVAVVQYCYKTAGEGPWASLWERSTCVWSYYDLQAFMPHSVRFYHAPLGVDRAFRGMFAKGVRDVGVVTSGYVHGAGAEAIEQVVQAAFARGLKTVHLGPMPVGLTRNLPLSWSNVHEISDGILASVYRRAQWVSGLRHVEGFELPALEGLCCGARPILFDRADMRQWYEGHALFVPEDDALEETLLKLFAAPPAPVTEDERQSVLDRFDWEPIVRGFWERAL